MVCWQADWGCRQSLYGILIRTRATIRVNQSVSELRSGSGMLKNEVQESVREDECTVTKAQLLHFFELKFLIADKDQDGQLNIGELGNFLRSVTQPNLRVIRSWERYT
jgi:hypothetical protein